MALYHIFFEFSTYYHQNALFYTMYKKLFILIGLDPEPGRRQR